MYVCVKPRPHTQHKMWTEVSSSALHFLQVGLLLSPIIYQGADKSLAQPPSRCILFDGQNISFDASLVI